MGKIKIIHDPDGVYEDAIEDVLVVMRSEFGMWETSPLYQRIEQLKEEKFD